MAEIEKEIQETSLDVTVVLPCYNEEEAIEKVIDDVRQTMEKTSYHYEILVVDDASTDQTVQRAKKKDVRIIQRPVNQGSGTCRKTGIMQAKGKFIVMLDADGTYTASDIPKLLEHMPAFDQVNGARTSEKGTMRWLRAPAKWLIRQFACYLTSTHIPDLNTGLKAFKRDVMLKYLWVLPKGFSCVTTMTLAFLINGYRVKYIPTEYHKRIGVSKFHPIKDAANYIQTILRMVMYFDPLKVFLPLGGMLFLLGIIKSIMSVKYTSSLQESDVIILLGAFVVVVLGLLADLIVAYQKRP